MREVGTHFFFLLVEIFGDVKRVQATVEYPPDSPGAAEIGALGVIETKSGVICSLDVLCDASTEEDYEFTVYGKSATLSLLQWAHLVQRKGNLRLPTEKDKVDGSVVLLQNFAKAIEGTGGDLVSFESAKKAQDVLEGILNSRGSWINI